jgi:NADH pyrophosphatase NudC (nudix superfamily)
MKVSFDFDNTLSRKDVQEFAKELVNEGHEVWIVTSRFDDETAEKNLNKSGLFAGVVNQNQKLFKVAEQCGIKKENIQFTCMESKSLFLEGKGFIFHLDDDDIELMDIHENNKFTGYKCFPVHVDHFEWKETCKDILKKSLAE